MYNIHLMESGECLKQLDSYPFDDLNGEEAGVVLEGGEEVVLEKVSLNEQMLTVIEDLFEVQQVVLVGIAVGFNVSQKFELV